MRAQATLSTTDSTSWMRSLSAVTAFLIRSSRQSDAVTLLQQAIAGMIARRLDSKHDGQLFQSAFLCMLSFLHCFTRFTVGRTLPIMLASHSSLLSRRRCEVPFLAVIEAYITMVYLA